MTSQEREVRLKLDGMKNDVNNSFIPSGVTPAPVPGVTTLSPPIPVCVYNGKSYQQGQTWQDGCRYRCECVDAMTGSYRCSER